MGFTSAAATNVSIELGCIHSSKAGTYPLFCCVCVLFATMLALYIIYTMYTSMSPATRFELRRSLLPASYTKPTIASRRIHRLVCVSEPTAIGGNINT